MWGILDMSLEMDVAPDMKSHIICGTRLRMGPKDMWNLTRKGLPFARKFRPRRGPISKANGGPIHLIWLNNNLRKRYKMNNNPLL